MTPSLLHELITRAAARAPQATALIDGATHLDYASLAALNPRERRETYADPLSERSNAKPFCFPLFLQCGDQRCFVSLHVFICAFRTP